MIFYLLYGIRASASLKWKSRLQYLSDSPILCIYSFCETSKFTVSLGLARCRFTIEPIISVKVMLPFQRTYLSCTLGNAGHTARTANKVLPKAGLNGFDWTFVQGSTFVLRFNFSAKIPAFGNTQNVTGKRGKNSKNLQKTLLTVI